MPEKKCTMFVSSHISEKNMGNFFPGTSGQPRWARTCSQPMVRLCGRDTARQGAAAGPRPVPSSQWGLEGGGASAHLGEADGARVCSVQAALTGEADAGRRWVTWPSWMKSINPSLSLTHDSRESSRAESNNQYSQVPYVCDQVRKWSSGASFQRKWGGLGP